MSQKHSSKGLQINDLSDDRTNPQPISANEMQSVLGGIGLDLSFPYAHDFIPWFLRRLDGCGGPPPKPPIF